MCYLCTRNSGMNCKRGVAQPGSAPVLGTGGRRFESCRPDIKKSQAVVEQSFGFFTLRICRTFAPFCFLLL